MVPHLVDMHCHLGFLDNAASFAQAGALRGMGFFSATVTPGEFAEAGQALAGCENVRVGAGLHPWWIDDGSCGAADVAAACAAASSSRYIGEVGLDFGKRHGASREAQLEAFERIARACAQSGGKLLTVHAVRAADAVLDVLERTRCLSGNDVIFHWFSDSNDALWRAIRAKCHFSVNGRMLATKRGREYAKAIPAERLLLETDLPPEAEPGFTLDAWENDLRETLHALEALRGEPLAARIARNSAALLGWA